MCVRTHSNPTRPSPPPQVHYFNRDFIFPLRLRGGKPTPFVVWLSAAVFCIYNGYMQVGFICIRSCHKQVGLLCMG